MTTSNDVFNSEAELKSWIEKFKSSLDEDTIVLFRGQVKNHDKIRSSKSRRGNHANEEIEHGWNNLVGRIVSSAEQPYVSSEKRHAILQHYGLATHYLDVTLNPLIAAWFATNQFTQLAPIFWAGLGLRNLNRVTYTSIKEGQGFIHVFVVPKHQDLEKKQKLIDIRGLEKFERPKRQEAFLIYDRPPLLPDINKFWHCTLKINREQFKSSFSMRHLFPTPVEDAGYKSLLNVPFVQVPLPEEPGDQTAKNAIQKPRIFPSFGVRAINVVDYVDDEKGDGGIDHKWGDFTLYEPDEFREWTTMDLEMKKFYPEVDLKFSNATKITLSPNVKSFCEKNCSKVALTWPQVNTNSIFLSYAQFEHDKVMDFIKPPFMGIWIYKENDLLIAVQISMGRKRLQTRLYGVFILKDNHLEPQETIKTKYPKNIAKRIRHVTTVLALHELVQYGPLIFVPHPYSIPKWYFVF